MKMPARNRDQKKPRSKPVTRHIQPREKVVEARIFAFLKNKDIFCWKNDSVGIFDPKNKIYRKNMNRNRFNGVSDILGILPDGRFLAIEVKKEGGKPTPDQIKFIAKILARGGVAFVADSVEEVERRLFGEYENYV